MLEAERLFYGSRHKADQYYEDRLHQISQSNLPLLGPRPFKDAHYPCLVITFELAADERHFSLAASKTNCCF